MYGVVSVERISNTCQAKKIHAEGYYTTAGKQNTDETQKPVDIQGIISRCTPMDTKGQVFCYLDFFILFTY